MGVQLAMSYGADRWHQVTWEQISHWGSKQEQHFHGRVVVEGRQKWAEERMGDKQMEATSAGNSFKSFAMKGSRETERGVKRVSLHQKEY